MKCKRNRRDTSELIKINRLQLLLLLSHRQFQFCIVTLKTPYRCYHSAGSWAFSAVQAEFSQFVMSRGLEGWKGWGVGVSSKLRSIIS